MSIRKACSYFLTYLCFGRWAGEFGVVLVLVVFRVFINRCCSRHCRRVCLDQAQVFLLAFVAAMPPKAKKKGKPVQPEAIAPPRVSRKKEQAPVAEAVARPSTKKQKQAHAAAGRGAQIVPAVVDGAAAGVDAGAKVPATNCASTGSDALPAPPPACSDIVASFPKADAKVDLKSFLERQTPSGRAASRPRPWTPPHQWRVVLPAGRHR